MGANFIYQSDNEKERLRNATKIFEELVNRKLEDVGADYRISYDTPTTKTHDSNFTVNLQ